MSKKSDKIIVHSGNEFVMLYLNTTTSIVGIKKKNKYRNCTLLFLKKAISFFVFFPIFSIFSNFSKLEESNFHCLSNSIVNFDKEIVSTIAIIRNITHIVNKYRLKPIIVNSCLLKKINFFLLHHIYHFR